MKASIIIPLYNLGDIIGKCIASAVDQDLPPEEYEIIVVDDGSTDGSFSAATKEAEGHGNVRVFTKPNAGVSEARNFGVDRARGDYIVFVDADDLLEPRMLGTAVAAMERERLDMLCVRARAVDQQGVPVPYWSDRKFAGLDTQIRSGKEVILKGLFPMVWAYVYTRELLTTHPLRMKPIRHEDEEFIPRALYYARRVGYLPELFYNYVLRPDSFMGNYRPEQAFQMVPAMQSLAQFAEEVEREGDVEGALTIRRRIGIATFMHCKRTVRRGGGNARELIERLHSAGLFPLQYPRRKFRYWLLNASTTLFILYYSLHSRK